MTIRCRIQTGFWFFLAFSAFAAQAAPPPAIEMTSLLEAFKVHHKTGRLDLNARTGANATFIPARAKLQVSIFRKGESKPLVSLPCSIRRLGGVWSSIQVAGASHYEFTQAGDYTITYFVNGKPATTFDFQVNVQSGDDPFEPTSYRFVNGPWNDLGFIQVMGNKPTTPLTFKFYTRQETPKPDNNMKASVQLFKDGELVAEAGTGAVAWAEWSLKEFSFTFPAGQGGQKFSVNDLVQNDGMYTITVKFDGELHGHYPLEVRSGKIVPHRRQTMSYKPKSGWLVPRRNQALDSAEAIYFLERTGSSQASPTLKQAKVTREQRKSWQVIPDADHRRPFNLVHTKILTRRDTPISAGDGIVAFATGRTQGVAYFRVGEDKQQSIPNGQQYRGDLFNACGKLIVLANRSNLFVYDTVSGQTSTVKDSDIHMRYRKGALYGPRLLDADGYLVVTVNEPNKVRDRSVIKVLDLSKGEPRVISLSNIGLTVDDVSSVKVSAKYGYVAVGSKRKQAIYVAPVAQGAKLKKFDISGYDSFGEMDMALLDHYVVYQDNAGFASVRALDIDTGKVITPDYGKHSGGWGTSVATNGQVVTWRTRDPHATFVSSQYFEQTAPLSNSNEKVSRQVNYGAFGVANVAVVAHEGTIFLSGSQSISESSCLQMSVKDRWLALRDEDGKPIPAIDVVAGDAMIAFKTGERSSSGPVSISYATYGDRIEHSPANRRAVFAAETGARAAQNKAATRTPTTTSYGPKADEVNDHLQSRWLGEAS